LLSTFFVLLVLPQPPILGQEDVTIEGVVKEYSTGNPIPHAKILILRCYYLHPWERYGIKCEKVFNGDVDSDGYFHLELPRWEEYIIYAYYNDSMTPGFDYVPSMKSVKAIKDYNLTFELWDGASIFLEGEAFFVETTETPQSSYSVLDPSSGEVIQQGEYTFHYGEESSHYQIPGVGPKHIIVPADTLFKVKVDSTVEVEEESLRHSFFIDKPGHFVLEKGERIHIDLREYTLPSCLSVVKAEASEIGLMINETEKKGFYLAVERQRYATITPLILEAENYYRQGDYEACFTRLREAYTEVSNLRNWIKSMHRESLKSVFLLIPFLAFTATTTSYLLFEEKIKKIGGATVFYALFLVALYLSYPGSRLVEASLFLVASLLSLLTVLGLSAWVPGVLKGREVRGRVPLRNIIVPVFSIAKRNLRRRRLRSTLTFITIMILVSSFIALTSFTTGFGLTFNKVSGYLPSTGVLVRAPKPFEPMLTPDESGEYFTGPEPEDVYWFPPLDDSIIRWFEERPDTILVAPKYENLPHYDTLEHDGPPMAYFGDGRIFGIIGIVPSAEVLLWNETIVKGRFLRDGDENGVLISAKLGKRLNAKVGESLTFRILGETMRLEIIGIFDDTRFKKLRDLDGNSPIPWKLISVDDDVYLTPCSPKEILVISWKTAKEIPGMFLSRLDIVCEEGKDLGEYAKMLALNKGFRAWVSTEDGVYLAQLASYFEWKGLFIAVPWGIVVLNVVVTMLGALYERRREIKIYSAIGMNPSHIAGALLVEAAMIGVLGGGLGYLLGLGWYKAMSLLALGLQVKQKVSVLWVLAAIAVSMAAVLTGGFMALKGSVVITPSLKRRWKIEASTIEPLELTLPVRVTEAEVEGFVKYVMERLRYRMEDLDYVTRWIRETSEETEEASMRTIKFFYQPVSPLSSTFSLTSNKVILRKEKDREIYTVKLKTQGVGAQRAASLIRQIIMEWSINRVKL
ncbi:hypothetical protein DRO56_05265, partial [Candidatus Bathyarchaeota archaeon]